MKAKEDAITFMRFPEVLVFAKGISFIEVALFSVASFSG